MEFAAAFRSAGTVRIEMVISTGEMPFWPIPIRIPEIMNQVRSWAKARHRRPAEKNRPAGIRVAMGPFLSRRMPRAGRATQPMREAAVANTPILAIPSSSRAKAAIKTVIPVRVP